MSQEKIQSILWMLEGFEVGMAIVFAISLIALISALFSYTEHGNTSLHNDLHFGSYQEVGKFPFRQKIASFISKNTLAYSGFKISAIALILNFILIYVILRFT